MLFPRNANRLFALEVSSFITLFQSTRIKRFHNHYPSFICELLQNLFFFVSFTVDGYQLLQEILLGSWIYKICIKIKGVNGIKCILNSLFYSKVNPTSNKQDSLDGQQLRLEEQLSARALFCLTHIRVF